MSHVLVVVETCAITFVLVCLFLPKDFLRVGTHLWSGDLLVLKEQPQHVSLPLRSGAVSYRSHKVY